ncbi:PTS transporter subunit EIIC [Kroppenstedtia pulmonis]|uniref:PTS transporter subunit EIIC n=1 Tax=Kroppenstedtia pulmonis TaxID=1380685 RepID=A0A7D3Y2T5_9BACL|nr:N-acetylglucosamine-specific PTS transporter subunit IIBC [Kroppenstedtia pulmonis]QKG83065.1 PTS transporter subunit EIIC [Kroppenstedtia pulmonis]
MKAFLAKLQQMGKSLMLPIAVMPAAAILLRLGSLMQDSQLGIEEGSTIFEIGKIVEAGGDAIFTYLPLLFAIGVAVGMTEGAGAAGLAAVAGYVVLNTIVGVNVSAPEDTAYQIKLNQTDAFGGILTGLVTSFLYKRYKDIRLPDWLQFFGGKRFVPIVTSLAMLLIGLLFLVVWPPVQSGISQVGNWIIASGGAGLFGYGLLNRLLIPFGLHHILNTMVWFNVGEFTNAAGEVFNGDMTRFFKGDPTAGIFMAGMYPILMFALPAACLAMLHEAKPSQRKAASGVLISAALTAFLTGITEPIEFSFMFLAPVLYVIHALLTGTSLAVMSMLGVKHGFGFSAGLIDYLLNFNLATKAWLIIPMGLAFGLVYYLVFRFAIRKWNLSTVGRLDEVEDEEKQKEGATDTKNHELEKQASDVLAAIGGVENIENLDACITRLRMTLKDETKLDKGLLKKTGASGVIRVGEGNYQAVFGTRSELLKEQIQKIIREDKSA